MKVKDLLKIKRAIKEFANNYSLKYQGYNFYRDYVEIYFLNREDNILRKRLTFTIWLEDFKYCKSSNDIIKTINNIIKSWKDEIEYAVYCEYRNLLELVK
jgi:hypothetical protein